MPEVKAEVLNTFRSINSNRQKMDSFRGKMSHISDLMPILKTKSLNLKLKFKNKKQSVQTDRSEGLADAL